MLRGALLALCLTLLFPSAAAAATPRLKVKALPGVTLAKVKKAPKYTRIARVAVPQRKVDKNLDLYCRGGDAPSCALTPKNAFGHLIGPNRLGSVAVAESVKVGYGGFGLEITWSKVSVETPLISVYFDESGGGGGDGDRSGGDKGEGDDDDDDSGDGGGEDESSDQ